MLPPRMHFKQALRPLHAVVPTKPSPVAKKSSHQEGCDCWCMPDEQDAQDGIVMQLQPFVSQWKVLYAVHTMCVCYGIILGV